MLHVEFSIKFPVDEKYLEDFLTLEDAAMYLIQDREVLVGNLTIDKVWHD